MTLQAVLCVPLPGPVSNKLLYFNSLVFCWTADTLSLYLTNVNLTNSQYYKSCIFTLYTEFFFPQHNIFLPCSPHFMMLLFCHYHFQDLLNTSFECFMLPKHTGQCQGNNCSQNKFVMTHLIKKNCQLRILTTLTEHRCSISSSLFTKKYVVS